MALVLSISLRVPDDACDRMCLGEFRSYTVTPAAGLALRPLLSVLTRAAAVGDLKRACLGTGVTCVAGGHLARPRRALDIPHLSLFVRFHVSASASAPLTGTPPT